jgi:hypothetical protein
MPGPPTGRSLSVSSFQFHTPCPPYVWPIVAPESTLTQKA